LLRNIGRPDEATRIDARSHCDGSVATLEA
jgi:hypothetical protein